MAKPLHFSETAHHKALINWAKSFWWSNLLIHIPNEMPIHWLGKKGFAYLHQQRQKGLRTGVADLLLSLPRNRYHGLWLELKATGKRPSNAQRHFLQSQRALGYGAEWSDNYERSVNLIKQYIQLPGKQYQCVQCQTCDPWQTEKMCVTCFNQGFIYEAASN